MAIFSVYLREIGEELNNLPVSPLAFSNFFCLINILQMIRFKVYPYLLWVWNFWVNFRTKFDTPFSINITENESESGAGLHWNPTNARKSHVFLLTNKVFVCDREQKIISETIERLCELCDLNFLSTDLTPSQITESDLLHADKLGNIDKNHLICGMYNMDLIKRSINQ